MRALFFSALFVILISLSWPCSCYRFVSFAKHPSGVYDVGNKAATNPISRYESDVKFNDVFQSHDHESDGTSVEFQQGHNNGGRGSYFGDVKPYYHESDGFGKVREDYHFYDSKPLENQDEFNLNRFRQGGNGDNGNGFNVVDFGAIGDGVSDDSQAFLKAWGAACGSSQGSATMIVPKGRSFLLKPLTFEGPCKSQILVQVLGSLVAPNRVDAWKGFEKGNWVVFSSVNGLTIDGGNSGQIDGQGAAWWKQCNIQSCDRPVALRLINVQNANLKGLRHKNSAKGHIGITSCKFVTVSNLAIVAPQDSPNTDGLDISASDHITIQSSAISTGDDCIAMNGGTSFINVTDVLCGPGHGISVGSLGANGVFDTVEEVRVQNCMLRGTENGLRIKTWQGGSGYARKISFSNINLDGVKNPIIIDQYYCGGSENCATEETGKAVEISDVTFSEVRGTSASEAAIALRCSRGRGCSNVVLHNVDIAPSNPKQKLSAECNNVQGRTFQVTPNVPCLAQTYV